MSNAYGEQYGDLTDKPGPVEPAPSCSAPICRELLGALKELLSGPLKNYDAARERGFAAVAKAEGRAHV